jgi:hypothetical protein
VLKLSYELYEELGPPKLPNNGGFIGQIVWGF